MKATTDKKRYTDSTKLLWHMDRVISHYDKGNRVAPIHIDVGLTKKCNIKCIFCYGEYQHMDGSVIQRDALLNNLVSSAATIGVRSLAFIGDGEPTLNPAYYDAMRLGKKKGLSLSTSTNGIKVDSDDKRAAILENCDWMRFCLSAVSEEGYQKIHRSNKRDEALDSVRKLVEYKHKHGLECDVGVQMVFVPIQDMMDEVIPESQFAIDSGVDYFLIKQCSLPDDGETGMFQFDIKNYDSFAVRNLLKSAERMSTDQTDIIPKWNVIESKGARKYDHCVGVQMLPEISGDGGFYPCAYFFGGNDPSKCYGNIHDNSLEEIIFSDKYWDLVKHMNEEFNPKEDCMGCCRQDMTNEFVWEYQHPPKAVNFI